MPIPRWVKGPFELLVQAELHFRGPTEQDRRLACVLFDNAVEVMIVTYVSLHKTQRRNRALTSDQVSTVSRGFHSALDFCFQELGELGLSLSFTLDDFVHFHRMRNEQYHGATLTVPGLEDTRDLRAGSIQMFEQLFGVSNLESEIENRIEALRPVQAVKRREEFDTLIDEVCELVIIGELEFTASEALYALDPNAYQELGQELVSEKLIQQATNEQELSS